MADTDEVLEGISSSELVEMGGRDPVTLVVYRFKNGALKYTRLPLFTMKKHGERLPRRFARRLPPRLPGEGEGHSGAGEETNGRDDILEYLFSDPAYHSSRLWAALDRHGRPLLDDLALDLAAGRLRYRTRHFDRLVADIFQFYETKSKDPEVPESKRRRYEEEGAEAFQILDGAIAELERFVRESTPAELEVKQAVEREAEAAKSALIRDLKRLLDSLQEGEEPGRRRRERSGPEA